MPWPVRDPKWSKCNPPLHPHMALSLSNTQSSFLPQGFCLLGTAWKFLIAVPISPPQKGLSQCLPYLGRTPHIPIMLHAIILFIFPITQLFWGPYLCHYLYSPHWGLSLYIIYIIAQQCIVSADSQYAVEWTNKLF